MKTVTFKNEGLIDPRAWSLFGASAKETSQPIGYFGTGLKYAIAVATRMGGRVVVHRGLETIEFEARETEMRGRGFRVLYADEQELGFTTELGRNWQAWQAFRELWCNALDEDGQVVLGAEEPEEGWTKIQVTHPDFVECYNIRDRIILNGEARWIYEGVEIYERPSQAVYYRRIKVHDLERPSRFTYNIVAHHMDLTEDRTLKHTFMADAYVRNAIVGCDSEELVRKFLTADKDSHEAHMSLVGENPGDTFTRVLDELTWRECTNVTARLLSESLVGKKKRPRTREATESELAMLARASEICLALGVEILPEYVNIATDLPDEYLGLHYDGEVFLADRTFSRGQRQVTGTLYEEALHALRGLKDESRELQNYLLDKLIEAAGG